MRASSAGPHEVAVIFTREEAREFMRANGGGNVTASGWFVFGRHNGDLLVMGGSAEGQDGSVWSAFVDKARSYAARAMRMDWLLGTDRDPAHPDEARHREADLAWRHGVVSNGGGWLDRLLIELKNW